MSKTLLLIPTAGEHKQLLPRIGEISDCEIRLCGFGPVASAARTAFLITAFQPERIILIGIAGALTRELPPGKAAVFDNVALYGIGAGAADTFRTTEELGWLHWNQRSAAGEEIPFGDRIRLDAAGISAAAGRQLLTVCSSAATLKEVYDRRRKFPEAIAEDMEGFGVALAAGMAEIPLTIIRGISNIAGDRDKARWRIIDALNSAADVLHEVLA